MHVEFPAVVKEGEHGWGEDAAEGGGDEERGGR